MNTPSIERIANGVLDDALEALSVYGPDLRNGMTSHAPMVVEALCSIGRPQDVMPWIDGYRAGMLPAPAAHETIPADQWRAALGQLHRFQDWAAFFAREIEDLTWRPALDRWAARLTPGICASASHGVIRVGHAVRGLAIADTATRRRELADALASWAYAYQELPGRERAINGVLAPEEAIAQVPMQPSAERRFQGTIVSALEGLEAFPAFGPVVGLLDVSGEPGALIPRLTDIFARVYLANAHDFLTSIVFVHGVTSIAALGEIIPHVSADTGRNALRFAWQASCGLYAAFGNSAKAMESGPIAPPSEDVELLIDRAVASGDDHVIKFTAVCAQQNAMRRSPAYLAAARHAMSALTRTA